MNILVAKNGSQLGPFSEADIHAKLASGELTSSDLGWKEGMAAWSPLAQMFASAPPAAAPPAPVAPPPQSYAPQGQPNPGAYAPQPQQQQQAYSPQPQPQSYAPQPYNAPQGQYAAPQTYNSPYPAPYQQGAVPQWGQQGAGSYAGFWMRFLATVIDGFAVGIPANIIMWIALQTRQEAVVLIVYLLVMAGYVCYFVLMESSAKQATLGKLALGLKVTDENGNRISIGQALGRNLGKIVSALILYIGFIMAGVSQRKQALHDMMAHTLVVRK